MWWPTELGEHADTSVRGFASHTVASFLPFLLAWLVIGMARPGWFQVGRVTTVLLWGLAIFIFVSARIPNRPVAALVLPPLLLVCWLALRRSSLEGRAPDVLDQMMGQVRLWNILVLPLIPAAAIAVYAVFHGLGLVLATNIVLYVITTPLGFWFFFRSLWVIFRPTPAGVGALGPPIPPGGR